MLAERPAARTAVLVRAGGVETDPVPSWRELFAAAYRAEDEHLVAVAAGDQAPRTSATDGLRALEAALAANRSMAEEARSASRRPPMPAGVADAGGPISGPPGQPGRAA